MIKYSPVKCCNAHLLLQLRSSKWRASHFSNQLKGERLSKKRQFSNHSPSSWFQGLYKNTNEDVRFMFQRYKKTIIVGVTGLWISLSIYNRKWRESKINSLPLATAESMNRNLKDVLHTVERAGLMGYQDSVKEELDRIWKWHQDHNYRGGLVVRELTEPLYYKLNHKQNLGGAVPGNYGSPLPKHAKRELDTRECYYLYYEVLGNGKIVQQIFCRGTTLRDDVVQCMKSVYLFDPELGCNIHYGFREHAERLLRDVEPLLVHSPDRGTIELAGHSLGGAVAMIVALKLIKRGYNVTKITTVAAPKLCDSKAVEILTPMLPSDVLRIENDDDLVPYMPPTGKHLGDKLLFISGKKSSARYLPSSAIDSNTEWIENTFLNCFLFEALTRMPKAHRTYSYISNFEQLVLSETP